MRSRIYLCSKLAADQPTGHPRAEPGWFLSARRPAGTQQTSLLLTPVPASRRCRPTRCLVVVTRQRDGSHCWHVNSCARCFTRPPDNLGTPLRPQPARSKPIAPMHLSKINNSRAAAANLRQQAATRLYDAARPPSPCATIYYIVKPDSRAGLFEPAKHPKLTPHAGRRANTNQRFLLPITPGHCVEWSKPELEPIVPRTFDTGVCRCLVFSILRVPPA